MGVIPDELEAYEVPNSPIGVTPRVEMPSMMGHPARSEAIPGKPEDSHRVKKTTSGVSETVTGTLPDRTVGRERSPMIRMVPGEPETHFGERTPDRSRRRRGK